MTLSTNISKISQNKCILILPIQCSKPSIDWKYTRFTEAQICTNQLLWTQELWIERCHQNHRHRIFLGLSHNAWFVIEVANWVSKRKGSDATAWEAQCVNCKDWQDWGSQQTAGLFLHSEWNWKFCGTGHVLPVFAELQDDQLLGDHL